MSSERNAPCPCGSGRKSKKCCQPAAAITRVDWVEVRWRLLDRLARDAGERLDEDAWHEAVDDYVPGGQDISDDAFAVSVLPWLVAGWRPSPTSPPPPGMREGESFVERALRKDRDLSTHERRFLEAWAHEPASWWIVESASPAGLDLRDAFRGHARHLRTRPMDLPVGAAMHARILELDGNPLVVELAPVALAPELFPRMAPLREHLRMPDPVDDAWLRRAETTMRLVFLQAASRSSRLQAAPSHASACIEPGEHGLDDALARLTTGLEHDPARARRALEDGVLRWRFVDPATGLPQRDAAWLILRNGCIELRALDATEDFEAVRAAVHEQVAPCGARLLDPMDALRRALDGIVPEPEPGPERALLRRLVAMEREAWGDLGFARSLGEPGIPSGLLLPVPESIDLCAFMHVTARAPAFMPGDEDVPADWRFGEPMSARAVRLGLLSDAELDTLESMLEAEPRTWLVLQVLAARCVRVADASALDGADAIVATLPAAMVLADGDFLAGTLIVPSDGTPARFLVALRLDPEHELQARTDLLTGRLGADWLDDQFHEQEYQRHFRWSEASEVYEAADPEAVLQCLPVDDSVVDEGPQADDEDATDESDDEPLRVAHWAVQRDASGGIHLAEGQVAGEINGAATDAVVQIRGHEVRLSSTDPDALSEWRADLARLVAPVTKLTWLRQDRVVDGEASGDHGH